MIDRDTIPALFEAQVALRPAAIAATGFGKSMSYKKLNDKANQLAHYLRDMGVKPDTPVAIGMERDINFLLTILGIMKAGGAYVPLDLSHPSHRLSFVLNDNNSPILITMSRHKEQFANYQGVCLFLDEAEKKISAYPSQNPMPLANGDNVAYIIYTSGSTGTPKGVLIEHKSVLNYCTWFANYTGVKPKQRVDFSSNFIFDMAVSTSIIPLMLGLTVVICDDETKKNIRRYLGHLHRNKVNLIKMTPSYLRVLAQDVKNKAIPLPHLHSIILGGENLRTVDCAAWLEYYPSHTLYNEYGPTETTVGVSVCKINHSNLSQMGINAPIGEPGPDMLFHILRADKKPVKPGEAGELYIGGQCLARGYLNQPALTQEKFIENPFKKEATARLYKTGDWCRQLPALGFEYIERIDQQVKINGFRIELKEVEACLVTHPAIKDAIALARDNVQGEKQLISYYIPKDTNNVPSPRELRHHLLTRLPDYMIPAAFVWVDGFPRTANDKLDQSALPTPKFFGSQHYVAPSSKLESTLAAIWSEVLDVKPIGIEDDFFELGGHSLSAVRIIAKIENTLGMEITLEDFYAASTVSKLVVVLKHAKKISKKRVVNKPSQTHNKILPLSDFQQLFWISKIFEPKLKKLNLVARKRVEGQLDRTILDAAFRALFKKHEILFYQICTFSPGQFLQKDLAFKLVEKDLGSLSQEDCELALSQSIEALINFSSWHKKSPRMVARLFKLPNDNVELQICMPHIIADKVSLDILFSDLSNFYLQHKQRTKIEGTLVQQQFKDFLLHEHDHIQVHLDRDLDFWKAYLNDVSLFPFPVDCVIEDMDAHGYPFSTYMEIPEQGINNLQRFCAKSHVSLTNGLCAALGLALTNCADLRPALNKKIMVNIVKSTRDNPVYDDKIGCFLRVDTIKIDMTPQQTLEGISTQIHKTVIDVMPYQRFPSMAKLACSNLTNWDRGAAGSHLLNLLIYIYTKLIHAPKLNYKIFSLYGRLSSWKRDNGYMININMLDNFITGLQGEKEPALFGLKQQPVKMSRYDLCNFNNVLEVCFLRDEEENKPYLVLSGNLHPTYREVIAKEAVRVICDETVRD